jgi:hypothetical protein
MMKIKNLFLLILFLMPTVVSALQSDAIQGSSKATVAVDYFNTGYGVDRRDFQWVDIFRANAIKGVNESGRVNTVDVANITEFRNEADAGAMRDLRNRYAVLVKNNVDYLVECDVNALTVRDVSRSRKDPPRWAAGFSYTVRIVTPKDGKVIATINKLAKENEMTSDVPEKAIQNAAEMVESTMNRYIKDNFRTEGQLLQILSSNDKGEAKLVAVNVGPANGAYKGSKFQVYETVVIAGRKVTNKIGEIKIKEVKDDNFSIGEVKKGGKDILDRLNKGQVLMILSDQAGFWD